MVNHYRSPEEDLMPDAATISVKMQIAEMIELIGEAVASRAPGIRRAAAREIIKLDCFAFSVKSTDELTHLTRAFGEIEKHLANPSEYFDQALLSELEPYPGKGILFPALVHLVRIEQDALDWGWLPEQLRALGLAINHGEELTWLTRDWAEISDHEGNRRRFYRFSS
jgi:hypothetical protein